MFRGYGLWHAVGWLEQILYSSYPRGHVNGYDECVSLIVVGYNKFIVTDDKVDMKRAGVRR